MNPAEKTIKLVDQYQQRFPWLSFPVAVWKKFGDDEAGNLAALVAYYAFASIFPLLLVFVTVLEIVLRHNAALQKKICSTNAVKNYGSLGADLKTSVTSFHQTGPALVIGILLTFLGARGVANAMQNALNSVWEVPKSARPGFPWSYLRSFGLILVVGLGEIATSVLSGLISGGHILPRIRRHGGRHARFADRQHRPVLARLPAGGRQGHHLARAPARRHHGGIVWQILQLVGGYYIGHQLAHSRSLYGSTFGDRAGPARLAVPAGRGHAVRRGSQRRLGPQAVPAQPGAAAHRRRRPRVPAIR